MRRLIPIVLLAQLVLQRAALCEERHQQVVIDDPFIELHTGPGRGYPVFYIAERGEHVQLLKEKTGEEMIIQEVAYLMRSGSPDSLDLMVATNYAVMAADLAIERETGRMVSHRNGSYTTVPIGATREGVKRVDVDELYDAAEYRPKVRHVLGKPMFLY